MSASLHTDEPKSNHDFLQADIMAPVSFALLNHLVEFVIKLSQLLWVMLLIAHKCLIHVALNDVSVVVIPVGVIKHSECVCWIFSNSLSWSLPCATAASVLSSSAWLRIRRRLGCFKTHVLCVQIRLILIFNRCLLLVLTHLNLLLWRKLLLCHVDHLSVFVLICYEFSVSFFFDLLQLVLIVSVEILLKSSVLFHLHLLLMLLSLKQFIIRVVLSHFNNWLVQVSYFLLVLVALLSIAFVAVGLWIEVLLLRDLNILLFVLRIHVFGWCNLNCHLSVSCVVSHLRVLDRCLRLIHNCVLLLVLVGLASASVSSTLCWFVCNLARIWLRLLLLGIFKWIKASIQLLTIDFSVACELFVGVTILLFLLHSWTTSTLVSSTVLSTHLLLMHLLLGHHVSLMHIGCILISLIFLEPRLNRRLELVSAIALSVIGLSLRSDVDLVDGIDWSSSVLLVISAAASVFLDFGKWAFSSVVAILGLLVLIVGNRLFFGLLHLVIPQHLRIQLHLVCERLIELVFECLHVSWK